MRQINITKSLAAADQDGISLSQTPLGAGNLTITGALATGGVATLDNSRRVGITSAGNDTGRTFTIYGTIGGVSFTEAVTGANAATASSVRDYDTITRIAVDAATAGAVEAGTTGVGATKWLALDQYVPPNDISIVGEVTGTVNWTVQMTNAPVLDQSFTAIPVVFDHSILAGLTASSMGSLNDPVTAVRFLINSGTGTLVGRVRQAGIRS